MWVCKMPLHYNFHWTSQSNLYHVITWWIAALLWVHYFLSSDAERGVIEFILTTYMHIPLVRFKKASNENNEFSETWRTKEHARFLYGENNKTWE